MNIQKRLLLISGLLLVMLWGLPQSMLSVSAARSPTDWPMYLHDISHSSNQNKEQVLSTANAGSVQQRWSIKTGGVIAASPIVVGGTVYVGSWDGYEYALDATTGAQKWKTFLGQTTNTRTGCIPTTAGVSAAPEFYKGVVYIAGGNQYFYALNASTGKVIWKTQVYTSQTPGDFYNWASTAIATVNGIPYAFLGISSLCDVPLVQGQLLQINLTSHAITGTFKVVPDGQVGGGIWTTPAIDTATTPPTVYVTTGTPVTGQKYSKAILAINAQTMQLISAWQVPDSETNCAPDPDFGTSPTLYTTSTGKKMLIAGHKNGYLYLLDRSNIAAGYVMRIKIARSGQSPQGGDGTLSTPVFVANSNGLGGVLYAAGGQPPTSGGCAISYASSNQGSVNAIAADSGNILWTHSTPGLTVLAAMAYENGVLVVASTTFSNGYLELLNSSNGTVLKSFTFPGGAYSAPSISGGRIFVGDVAGNIYAFS